MQVTDVVQPSPFLLKMFANTVMGLMRQESHCYDIKSDVHLLAGITHQHTAVFNSLFTKLTKHPPDILHFQRWFKIINISL